MPANILEYVYTKFPSLKSSSGVIGASGGIDSMVLLDILRQLGTKVNVAHVNYMLRGEDSEADAKFVEAYCSLHKLPFFGKRVNTNALLVDGGNLQEIARDIRYQHFQEVKNQTQSAAIFTAHHANDSAETLLLNLCRGTDVKGLSGIPETRDDILRPLLGISKADIILYATEHNIQYRDDASNAKNAYARNAIRNVVIPVLENSFPNLTKRLGVTMAHAASATTYIDLATAQLIKPYLTYDGNCQLIHYTLVEEGAFGGQVLYRYLKHYGFNEDQVTQLVTARSKSGKHTASDTHVLAADREHFVLVAHADLQAFEVRVDKSEGIDIMANKNWQISDKQPDIHIEYVAIDRNAVQFPLVVRSRQEGDRICVAHSPKRISKIVKKLYVDAKLRYDQKVQTPILVNGDGTIIAVLGLAIDPNFQSESSDSQMYVFRKKLI